MNMTTERIYLAPDAEAGGGGEAGDTGGEASEPISLEDGASVAWDGLDEPLSIDELREYYQKGQDYTQKTQKLSEERQQWEQQLQEAQQWRQYAQQLEAYYQQQQRQAQQQQPQQGQAGPLDQIFQKIESNGGYVDGESLRQLVDIFQNQTVGGLQQQQQQILQALGLLYNDYQQRVGTLDELRESRAENSLSQRIQDQAQRLGVPEAAMETFEAAANDLYRSYTGDDLNDAFPELMEKRWQSLRKAFKAADKADLEAAKKGIPGKGGKAVPSKDGKPIMDVQGIMEAFSS